MLRHVVLLSLLAVTIPAALAQDAKPQPAATGSRTGTQTVEAKASRTEAAGSQASQTEAAEPRTADHQAIRETMASFSKAFEARDAKTLAEHWTTEGEHKTVRGVIVRGRPALEAGFTEFFAATPEVTAEVQPDSLRFLSSGAAIEEGTVTIRKGPAASPTKARYEALLVRDENRWRLASLSESPEHGVSVSDLAWLVGEWKSAAGAGAEIRTRYAWDAHKKFIHVQFDLTEGKRTLSGRQVIGVDPATGSLHSWTFEANGGVGEADWSRDGDHWVLTASGTLPGGGTLSETNILRRVSADTLTWQSTGRLLNGSEIADLAPVKVTRVPSAP